MVVVLLTLASAASAAATAPDAADQCIKQFLAQDDTLRPYKALRRLEAKHGDRAGWLEATTEYSPATGFRYQVSAEGGSSYMRSNVLKAVLDAERDLIARGEAARSALTPTNYEFQPNGIDGDGLANVLLSPRRKERVLVAGMMALNATDGALLRLQGRLAKSPSFWVKNVDIVRTYKRIAGIVVPVALDSTAQVRFAGDATLRMTYAYSEIDGRAIGAR